MIATSQWRLSKHKSAWLRHALAHLQLLRNCRVHSCLAWLRHALAHLQLLRNCGVHSYFDVRSSCKSLRVRSSCKSLRVHSSCKSLRVRSSCKPHNICAAHVSYTTRAPTRKLHNTRTNTQATQHAHQHASYTTRAPTRKPHNTRAPTS